MVTLPSMVSSFRLLIRNLIVIYLLALACELLLGRNQGVQKIPIDSLMSYIGNIYYRVMCCLRHPNIDHSYKLLSEKHSSIVAEEQDVESIKLRGGSDYLTRVIIDNLTKDYQTGLCQKTMHALKGVKFQTRSGELLAILGQNGAGKTTFINILTGFTHQTSGDAYVFGFSLSRQLSLVRNLASLCP